MLTNGVGNGNSRSSLSMPRVLTTACNQGDFLNLSRQIPRDENLETPHLCLTNCATAWVGGTEIPDVESLDLPDTVLGQLIAAAYKDQTLLGWNMLFWGFWAKNWRIAQEEQFRLYRSREHQDTSDRWSGEHRCGSLHCLNHCGDSTTKTNMKLTSKHND